MCFIFHEVCRSNINYSVRRSYLIGLDFKKIYIFIRQKRSTLVVLPPLRKIVSWLIFGEDMLINKPKPEQKYVRYSQCKSGTQF